MSFTQMVQLFGIDLKYHLSLNHLPKVSFDIKASFSKAKGYHSIALFWFLTHTHTHTHTHSLSLAIYIVGSRGASQLGGIF